MTQNSLEIAEWLKSSVAAVAFTGAGVSTDSGIPDFRSPGGIWSTSQPVEFQQFLKSPSARQEYWRQKSASHWDFARAKPNPGHLILNKWLAAGRLRGVITQNIDGLHQLAGGSHVIELHGTARMVTCLQCATAYESGLMVQKFLDDGQPPNCPECGGLLKHATISFGQSLPEAVLAAAIQLSEQADLFLAVGSSLVVQPAAGLPLIARQCGARLVIINRDPTPLDRYADAVIRASISDTLAELDRLLDPPR